MTSAAQARPATTTGRLLRALPFLRWWPSVGRETLEADAIAGLVGAIIVLPQGVAFATLAGMPPEYGLYAAMVPAVVAALWGSSWHLVSGPTNAISLVVFATVSPLAEPGTGDYVGLVLTLTLMVGAMQLALGLLRFGSLVNFISHTVVVGFTAGAALLIVASQVWNFFGVSIPPGTGPFATLARLVHGAGQINPYAVAVGVTTLAAGIAARRYLPRIPYMICALVAGALAALALDRLFGAERTGIATLGALPGALPPLSMPSISAETLGRLAGVAVAVTALALTEAVSIARSIAVKSGQRIDGNQEFIGQGLSNLAGAFFSAYPSSGSFNRSGLNYQAGARTPLAAAFSAVFLVVALLVVAPWAAYLPIASMAAVLFLVAWGLFDFHHIAVILRTSRQETAVLAATIAATLVMPLELAILVGVLLSLLLYLARTSQPAVRTLVPDAADAQRRFHPRRPGDAECPQLAIARVEGSIYFGAADHVGEALHAIASRQPARRHLLLMAKGINFVDIAGAELLAGEARRRAAAGGRLWLCGLRQGTSEQLHKPDFRASFGDDAFFASKQEALARIVAGLDASVCAGCRTRIFVECRDRPAPATG